MDSTLCFKGIEVLNGDFPHPPEEVLNGNPVFFFKHHKTARDLNDPLDAPVGNPILNGIKPVTLEKHNKRMLANLLHAGSCRCYL